MAHLKRSLGIALWFIFLTLPLMVVRVNTISDEIEWRWDNLVWVGVCAFAISWFWQFSIERRAARRALIAADNHPVVEKPSLAQRLADDPVLSQRVLLVAAAIAIVFPWLVSTGQNFYHVNVMVSALIFVVLGLGLNITVGLAGLLDLGYVAFFAVGAYTYALLSKNFDLGFWTCLPLGGIMGDAVRHRSRLPDPAPARRLPGDRHARLRPRSPRSFSRTGIRCSAVPQRHRRHPAPRAIWHRSRRPPEAVYSYYIMLALVVLHHLHHQPPEEFAYRARLDGVARR